MLTLESGVANPALEAGKGLYSPQAGSSSED